MVSLSTADSPSVTLRHPIVRMVRALADTIRGQRPLRRIVDLDGSFASGMEFE